MSTQLTKEEHTGGGMPHGEPLLEARGLSKVFGETETMAAIANCLPLSAAL